MIDSGATAAVQTLVFCLGAVIFYVVIYRSRIVPRWIALWGLVAIPFYAAADVLAVYAVIDVNSTAQNLLFAPVFVQEMVLAAWMIARGFRPVTPSTGREQPRRPNRRVQPSSVRHVVSGEHVRSGRDDRDVAQLRPDRWPCPRRLMPLARGEPVETARRAAASSLRRTWAAACPADTSAGVLRWFGRPGGLLGGCWAGMGTLLVRLPRTMRSRVGRETERTRRVATHSTPSRAQNRQPMPPPPIIPLRKAAESVMPSWLI